MTENVAITFSPVSEEKWDEFLQADLGTEADIDDEVVFVQTWYLWTAMSIRVGELELVPGDQPQAISLIELLLRLPEFVTRIRSEGSAEWEVGYAGPRLNASLDGSDVRLSVATRGLATSEVRTGSPSLSALVAASRLCTGACLSDLRAYVPSDRWDAVSRWLTRLPPGWP